MDSPPEVQAYVIISFVLFIAFAVMIFFLLVNLLTDRAVLKKAQRELKSHAENLERMVEGRTSQIKVLERQRSESEKLAATGRMAARIAHEINNPLAGIKNSFRLVKDSVPETHQYYSYVRLIDEEIDRVANIVRHMYILYKKEPDVIREFSLEEAVRDIIISLEPSCQPQNVSVKSFIAEDLSSVNLSEKLLRQVLYNLIINAIEASPPSGEVMVEAQARGDDLVISVSDHGKGIPEEIQSRIFEPFFTTKNDMEKAGLGFGLSESKSMTESMGGTISFETSIDKGTKFIVAVPLGESAGGKSNA